MYMLRFACPALADAIPPASSSGHRCLSFQVEILVSPIPFQIDNIHIGNGLIHHRWCAWRFHILSSNIKFQNKARGDNLHDTNVQVFMFNIDRCCASITWSTVPTITCWTMWHLVSLYLLFIYAHNILTLKLPTSATLTLVNVIILLLFLLECIFVPIIIVS